MKAENLIKKRRSIRSYKSKKVPRKLIKEILKLANLAPTASGKENRKFIIVENKYIKEKLYQTSFKQSHIKEAPIIIAVCCDTNLFKPKTFIKKSAEWNIKFWGVTEKNYSKNKKFIKNWSTWKNLWPIQDADAAITTLCLAALSKGLSTCWIGLFEHEKVKKILNLPRNFQIAGLITLGYQKKAPHPQKRKNIKELLHWNHW